MITLENSLFLVTLLHPVEDRHRLGPRYSTGGYVYQVEHRRHGPLLSGPEYPATSPSVINGQGAPEVFQNTLYEEPDEIPSHKLVIGVGLVANTPRLRQDESHFQGTVEKFCDWQIETDPSAFTGTTAQEHRGFALSLTRSVRLLDETIESRTIVANTGGRDIPLRWFAHPFFPLPASARFDSPLRLPADCPFQAKAGDPVTMQPSYPWDKGHFAEAGDAPGHPLRVSVEHPSAGIVQVRSDFPLARLAFWANDRTFSLEPFFASTLTPGASASWSLTYTVPGGKHSPS